MQSARLAYERSTPLEMKRCMSLMCSIVLLIDALALPFTVLDPVASHMCYSRVICNHMAPRQLERNIRQATYL